MNRIEYWWSHEDVLYSGCWYAEVLDTQAPCYPLAHSEECDFPAFIGFEPDESALVRKELQEAFPNLEIREV